MRPLIVRLLLAAALVAPTAAAQSLFAPRATGLGGIGATVTDTRGFALNPAGLAGMRPWEVSAVTWLPLGTSDDGFVFHGVALGASPGTGAGIALQYSPGVTLSFVEPAVFRTGGSVADREITYEEPLTIGGAYAPATGLSLGMAVRMRTETLLETRYEIVDTFLVFTDKSKVTTWHIDLGAQWQAAPGLVVGIAGWNLATLTGGSFPAAADSLRLPSSVRGALGASYEVTDGLRLAAEASTDGLVTASAEWRPAGFLALRGGYLLGDNETGGDALSAGAGVSWEFLEVDVAYQHFLDQTGRTGTARYGEFDANRIVRLDLNPYVSDRLLLSAKVVFGPRESLVHILGVTMYGGIYPSSYQSAAMRPVGRVRVRNVSARPVMARASFYVERFMDAPTEAPGVMMAAGEERDIEFTAVFNDLVRSVPSVMIKDGDVRVSATPTEEYDDREQTRVLIHGRNDWDGTAESLRWFVRPDDPAVLRFTRDLLLQYQDTVAASPAGLEAFTKARLLFNAFAGKLIYVNDPKQSADNVQYPSETLTLRGGDCDDMSVVFSSLLNSIGVSTAFVDVVPPGRPHEGHIYLLFDTGVPAAQAGRISENRKRYVIRADERGEERVWIPVDPTASMRGFEAAWGLGAQEYFREVEVELGMVKGWVRVVDVR
jgi:transglutaminase-like putative cysteine protease